MKKAVKLATKNDFVVISEAHCMQGRADALRLPAHLTAFWSDGTAGQAGVGLIVKRQFLELFNPVDMDTDWVQIEPGRVAVLRLNGKHGSMDIFCTYLATGDSDSAQLRVASIKNIGNHIRPRGKALSIITGDFNFVEQNRDRWSTEAGAWSGWRDSAETKTWHESAGRPHGIHEWEQNHFMHNCQLPLQDRQVLL